MEDTKQKKLNALQNEIAHTRAAYDNMRDFTGWEWGAYKVESHEKDAVINALEYYLKHLKEEEELLNDTTELCE